MNKLEAHQFGDRVYRGISGTSGESHASLCLAHKVLNDVINSIWTELVGQSRWPREQGGPR